MKEDLQTVINNFLEEKGYALVEFCLVQQRTGPQLRVVPYSERGMDSVSLGKLNQELRSCLEFNPYLQGEKFGLEVSSPGLSRRIKKKQEYRIFRGKDIRVFTTVGQEVKGKIKDFVDDVLLLLESNQEIKVPFVDISWARIYSPLVENFFPAKRRVKSGRP